MDDIRQVPFTEDMSLTPPKLPAGLMVFARWEADRFYYPAVVEGVSKGVVNVKFLDGVRDSVFEEHVIVVAEAFGLMVFEADWEKRGGFYECEITKRYADTYVVKYKDGVVETVGLGQLRASHLGRMRFGGKARE
jgi:hypothetical protein